MLLTMISMSSTLLVVSGLFHALFLLPCVASPPTVVLDGATITGIVNGSVAKYLGIPFAQPPYVYLLLYISYLTDFIPFYYAHPELAIFV